MRKFPTKLVLSAIALTAAVAVATYAQAQDAGEKPQRGIMKRVDLNQDGKVTREEMASHSSKRFEKLDTNKDGSLTEDEIRSQMKRKADRRAKRIVRRTDTNKDGQVSRQEYFDHADKRFSRIDANGDGTITKDEMDSARAKMRDKMKKRAGDSAG